MAGEQFIVPAVLAEKAYRFFGQAGLQWLGRLPELYSACVAKWGLRDCRVSPVISMNYICFAESPDYGPVALKIGVPNPELGTEIHALKLFGGRGICRLHDCDLERGAMLIERIDPGHDLTTISSRRERTAIAAALIAGLSVPHSADPSLPRYADWMERAFTRTRREGRAGERFLAFVAEAERRYSDTLRRDGGQAVHLLHGDLNHWNMLYHAGTGTWKAIDPKGATGPRWHEAGRFIINELELPGSAVRPVDLAEMAAVMGAAMGEPAEVVALSGFLDKVLSTCWTLEEHVQHDLAVHVDHCQVLLDACRALSGEGSPP